MYGNVIKINEDNYIVGVDLEVYGSGYGVVSKEEDPENLFDIEEVRKYCEENPDKVYSSHPLEGVIDEKQSLIDEKATLENYLNRTDYIVVKCTELGLDVETEYPEKLEKRKNARIRINEIDELLKGE